jgi:hypothetical protein
MQNSILKFYFLERSPSKIIESLIIMLLNKLKKFKIPVKFQSIQTKQKKYSKI